MERKKRPLSFNFKGSPSGRENVQSYARLEGIIDWLLTAGLILKIQIVNQARLPLSAFTEENAFKLYFFDVGILGAISQLTPKTILDYDYGRYKGYFAENFVAQEFTGSGVDRLFCWRETTAEVEFLREIEGKVYPIEVKSGWVTKSKSLNVFDRKYSPDYRIVMSARNLKINHDRMLHYYPLYLASRFPLPESNYYQD